MTNLPRSARFPASRFAVPAWAALALLAGAALAQAAAVDTTILGIGSPGPYLLGAQCIDSSTISARYADSARGLTPPYIYVDAVNGILFSEPLDSGVPVRVSFRTRFLGLPKYLALNRKAYLDTSDSAIPASVPSPAAAAGISSENLSVSGYKSVGVQVGSQGQVNLQQGLDVTIFGEVARETELSAHISDEGASMEGATREIGELDRVYVTLKNPRYGITVGDQIVSWPVAGLVSDSKKIKGVLASVTPRRLAVSAFGALSGGKYAVQNLRGQSGRQGPYRLAGNGEPDIITPIAGTVKVTVNGTRVSEGEDKQCVVDYDLGTLTFTPRFPVTDYSVIRVEYEYKTFDYQRVLAGAAVAVAAPESVLSVAGGLWYEADNKSQPIDFTMTKRDERRLAEVGDSSGNQLYVRPVHPQDVASCDADYPLYKKNAEGHYVFHRFNPQNPGDNQGFFRVTFERVDTGGDYAVFDTVEPYGEVYQWVGGGRGTAVVPATVPLPGRSVLGQIRVRAKPLDWLCASVDVLGQSIDRNMFSSRDDADNNGALSDLSLVVGHKRPDRRSAWLSAAHRLITRNFTREVVSDYENETAWNNSFVKSAGSQLQTWEAGGGIGSSRGASTQASYAQLRRNDSLITDRVSNTTHARIGDRLDVDYSGRLFRAQDSAMRLTRRDELGLSLDIKQTSYSLGGFDEWRNIGSDSGAGHIGAKAGFGFRPLGLSETVRYSRHSRGPKDVASPDTGWSLLWEQSLASAIVPNWQVTAATSVHRHSILGLADTTTLLAAVTSDVSSPSRGFTSRQEYSVNSEQASSFVQVAKYRGKGLGTHRYDPTLGEYVPDKNGDFILQEQERYDNAGGEAVRKSSLRVSWSRYPLPTSASSPSRSNLRWRGELGITEHVSLTDSTPGISWLPGYLTLASSTYDSLVSYASCSYRQNVTWTSQTHPEYQLDIHAEPFVKNLRGKKEHGVGGGLGAERTKDKWRLRAEPEALWFDHARRGAPERYEVTDVSLKLIQKYSLPLDIRPYVEETGGWARQRADAGWYALLKPGLTWEPQDRGWAELSYTFSYVGIRGDNDYRMASGFENGVGHTIDLFANVKLSDHFSLDAGYRGELVRRLDESEFGKANHVVSMEVKAFM